MYYGMEHLMTGYSNPDGNVRLDFKGGWDKDSANKFTAAGRTDKENEIFNYIRTLARFRKTSPALTTGKMMQYLPVDGLYVYFRYAPGQTIMCIMNTSDKPAKVDFANYPERIRTTSRGKNIVDGTVLSTGFEIPAKKMWTLEMLN
jgi:glycosidase